MLAITRQTTAFATLLLVVTITATFVRLYLNPFEVEIAYCSFLPRWWEAVISALLIFVTAIVVNRTAVKMGVLGGFGTLPVSLYGFLSCGILLTPNLLIASITATLTAFGVMYLLKSIVAIEDRQTLFTGALCLGSATVICPAMITLVVALVVSVFVIPLTMRKVVITLAGFFIPLLGASYVHWYMGGDIADVPRNFVNILSFSFLPELSTLPIITAALVLLVGVLLFYGVVNSIFQRYALLVSVRKTIQMVGWFFVATLLALLLPCGAITIIPAVAVPTTIILAFAIDRMEQNSANICYSLFILLVIAHLFLY